jgi:hydroxymethylbilane synthase
VKRLRPDIEVIGFRGNVETRLRKLGEGAAGATFLACAGLNRLGLSDRITSPMPVDVMVPAVAQGAIAVEIRAGDERTADLVAVLNDEATSICVTAERAFLARLEGSCRTPIAGHAKLEAGTISFRGETFSPDGRECFSAARSGPAGEASSLGGAAADEILARGGAGLLARLA